MSYNVYAVIVQPDHKKYSITTLFAKKEDARKHFDSYKNASLTEMIVND